MRRRVEPLWSDPVELAVEETGVGDLSKRSRAALDCLNDSWELASCRGGSAMFVLLQHLYKNGAAVAEVSGFSWAGLP